MKHKKILSGFTLVELIVVVTIISILSTIGFVAYESYVTDSRDSKRLALMKELRDSLRIYSLETQLPLPDDAVEMRRDGIVFAYQGYAGETVLESLNLDSEFFDPKDDTFFTYQTNADRDVSQVMAYLEEKPIENFLLSPQTYASKINYSKRFPITFGKPLGMVIENSTQIPLQEIAEYKSQGYIDFYTDTGDILLQAVTDGNERVLGTPSQLIGIAPFTTCNTIFKKNPVKYNNSGFYTINPTGIHPFLVYCDMETDGGGWTFTTFISHNGRTNGVFRGQASEPYYPDRREANFSYGLDTRNIPHEEMYIVIDDKDVTEEKLGRGEIFNIKYNYKKPIFGIPYEWHNDPYDFRFGFTGAYLRNNFVYHHPSFYQVDVRKTSFTKGLGMKMYEEGFLYTNESGRTDSVFYNRDQASGSAPGYKDAWFYVR